MFMNLKDSILTFLIFLGDGGFRAAFGGLGERGKVHNAERKWRDEQQQKLFKLEIDSRCFRSIFFNSINSLFQLSQNYLYT